MISMHSLVNWIVCLALMAVAAAFAPRSAAGGGFGVPEACRKWPQNRLAVGSGLQSRHFMLEARGQTQQMPPYLEVAGRRMFHRTFSLSLDVAEPIALYRAGTPKTCVIARDSEKALPFRVPVFFVGRLGQSSEELRADAERTAFAPSAPLQDGADFAEVTFRLRRGGASFTDIRPFFACGLAGLVLCEGYCPGETVTLARSLVDWIIKGVEWHPPVMPAAAEPAASQEAATSPEPETKPAATASSTPPTGMAPPPTAPMPEPIRPARPTERNVPAPQTAQPPALAENPPVQQEAAPQPPAAVTPPAQQEAQPVPQAPPPKTQEQEPVLRRLLLVFERKTGDAISPADVLKAEGSVKIEGVLLTATAEGLAAELPEEVFARSNTFESLQKLFPHYRLLGVKIEEARTVITAAPAPKAGPILIALVSTDSDLSSRLGAPSAGAFWSSALDLVSAVSGGSWEKKVLARAQSPGFSAETGVLEESWGEKLADGPARNSILRKLIEGSRSGSGSPITRFKPIQRFELDLALEPIKQDAGILAENGGAQEVLLLITGSIDPGGSYFCRHPVRPDTSQLAMPRWAKQAKKIFVLEVWSEEGAETLKRISRAKAAEGAPPGIYLCNIPGTDGANAELYGIEPEALSESARLGTFQYLTAQANSYLRP